MPNKKITNAEIAGVFDQIADLLEFQRANPHRIRAYRNGAQSVRAAQDSLEMLVRSGNEEALQKLPDIGQGLARLISTYVKTGRSSLLDRLQGEVSPEDLLKQVPGIGDELARRIEEQLDVHSLEELERAAYDGRLNQIEGFGSKRIQAVRTSLAGMLSRSSQRKAHQRVAGETHAGLDQPDIKTLLEVDAEYRRKAEAGELRKIAPRRFNPEGEAWLPILHTDRAGWHFTALYSNTAQAHRLGTTHDWVVLYYERDNHESQATVVTETSGILEGKRVIRGREADCRRYYQG